MRKTHIRVLRHVVQSAMLLAVFAGVGEPQAQA